MFHHEIPHLMRPNLPHGNGCAISLVHGPEVLLKADYDDYAFRARFEADDGGDHGQRGERSPSSMFADEGSHRRPDER